MRYNRSDNYIRSLVVHEFGHALHLVDYPRGRPNDIPVNGSVMLYDRNWELYRPTSFDIGWVNNLFLNRNAPIGGVSPLSQIESNSMEGIVETEHATSGRSFHASFIPYASLDEMVRSTDLIISGQVINTITKDIDVGIEFSLVIPHTVASIRVTEVVSGNLNIGDVIEVKQIGNRAMPESSTDYFAIGQNYLLFLMAFDGIPYYATMNPVQGQYTIDNAGNIIAHPNNRMEISARTLRALSE